MDRICFTRSCHCKWINIFHSTDVFINEKNQKEFENIVIGYDALLTQKLKGYEVNIEKLKKLNQLLTTANK